MRRSFAVSGQASTKRRKMARSTARNCSNSRSRTCPQLLGNCWSVTTRPGRARKRARCVIAASSISRLRSAGKSRSPSGTVTAHSALSRTKKVVGFCLCCTSGLRARRSLQPRWLSNSKRSVPYCLSDHWRCLTRSTVAARSSRRLTASIAIYSSACAPIASCVWRQGLTKGEAAIRFTNQTPEQSELWSTLMVIASWQLWLARSHAEDKPRPWQKPQPPEKMTPGRVHQAMGGVLARIGTPASDPKARGNSPGWPVGRIRAKRTRYDVVRKRPKETNEVKKEPPKNKQASL